MNLRKGCAWDAAISQVQLFSALLGNKRLVGSDESNGTIFALVGTKQPCPA